MKKALFSANDLGGAQAIMPVVDALTRRGWECRGVLTGLARGVFGRGAISFDDGSAMTDEDLSAYINAHQPNIFLAGRSVAYTVDKRMLLMLRERNIPSVYVLDFWNYYHQWFSDTDTDFKYLPDIVCVMDEMARQDMIAEGFPSERLRVTGNPHFEHFADGIERGAGDPHRILFMSQPIKALTPAGKPPEYEFDEIEVFEALERAFLTLPGEYCLQIRLHPKEDPHHYDSYLGERISLATEPTLEEAIAEAGLVVGMFSPVLLQALAAGKPVISYEPGLTGVDPFPTNRLGLTKRLDSEPELAEALRNYAEGKLKSVPVDLSAFWPSGAAESIADYCEKLCSVIRYSAV